MISRLLGVVALVALIAVVFKVPALYPAAIGLEHAFVGFLRAILNGA